MPADAAGATLVGRVHDPAVGPCVVAVRGDEVVDLTETVPTMSDLLDRDDAVAMARSGPAARTWSVSDLLDGTLARDYSQPHLLAPFDLQVIKAAGVTFARSMLERVIEEQRQGRPGAGQPDPQHLGEVIGGAIARVTAGLGRGGPSVKEVLHRGGSVVAVPRGGHRSRSGDLHQGPGARRPSAPAPTSASWPGRRGTTPSLRSCSPSPAGRRGRRNAGQRCQPARLRRTQCAAARRGEGQQRLLCDRPVHPPVRRVVHARRRPARWTSPCGSTGRTGYVLEAVSSMSEISRDPLDLVGHAPRTTPPVPGRLRPVHRHDVRADRRPGCARTGLHPQEG